MSDKGPRMNENAEINDFEAEGHRSAEKNVTAAEGKSFLKLHFILNNGLQKILGLKCFITNNINNSPV